MTTAQLVAVMKFHLSHFNDEGVSIDGATIHGDVLSDSDGYGTANSMTIYKNLIRWTLKRAKVGDPAWPKGWMKQSVADVAAALLRKE